VSFLEERILNNLAKHFLTLNYSSFVIFLPSKLYSRD